MKKNYKICGCCGFEFEENEKELNFKFGKINENLCLDCLNFANKVINRKNFLK